MSTEYELLDTPHNRLTLTTRGGGFSLDVGGPVLSDESDGNIVELLTTEQIARLGMQLCWIASMNDVAGQPGIYESYQAWLRDGLAAVLDGGEPPPLPDDVKKWKGL